MKKLKCASFFAGVGGIDIAFENNNFEIIYANEFDEYAKETYELNHKIKIDCRDIKTVKSSEITNFDVMLAGFPCQAFSIAGLQEGFSDSKGRGDLFFELIRIIKDKKPKVVFLENVKNLVSHDNGNTFKVILEELNKCGYKTKYKIMNAKNYGNIPQNRERVYIVSFKDEKYYENFEFPDIIPLTNKLSKYIDFNNKIDDKYYYSKSCSFYDILLKEVIDNNTVYQWRRTYVRANKNNVCPTLTANMGTGGHNVPIIKSKYGIRKLTPLECFALQGFPNSFKIPNTISNTRAYKQAGNSVVIPVIDRIAKNIEIALNNI